MHAMHKLYWNKDQDLLLCACIQAQEQKSGSKCQVYGNKDQDLLQWTYKIYKHWWRNKDQDLLQVCTYSKEWILNAFYFISATQIPFSVMHMYMWTAKKGEEKEENMHQRQFIKFGQDWVWSDWIWRQLI